MIDLRYLRAFQSVFRHLSLTKASIELKVGVSALSRQISLLEESAGGELFVRNTRQLVPTALGRRVYEAYARFEQDVSATAKHATLRVGCLESVFKYFLAGAIARNPVAFGGALDLQIGSPASLHERILEGNLDLLVTNLKPPATAPLSAFPLFHERLSWIGKARDRERPVVFTAFEHAYPENMTKAKNRIRVNSFEAASELVELGVGSALVALPAGKILRKQQSVTSDSQQIYVVVPNYKRLAESIRPALQAIKKEALRFG